MDHLKLFRNFELIFQSSHMLNDLCIFCCENEELVFDLNDSLKVCVFCIRKKDLYIKLSNLEFLAIVFLARKQKRQDKFLILKSKFNSIISFEIAKY